MIVSTDIRLASMISAMSGTVLPTVRSSRFATEQAQLVVGRLLAFRVQGEFSDEYELLEHRYMRRLADDLADGAEGGPQTMEAAARLRGLLDRGEPTAVRAVREAHGELSAAVADFVAAEGEDGTDASVARSTRIVLRAEHAQSLRDRSFFAPFGYEDGSVEIAPIDRMMAEFRASFPTRDGAAA